MILDEADEMLKMGFREDIELVLSNMQEERQTILFFQQQCLSQLLISLRIIKKTLS